MSTPKVHIKIVSWAEIIDWVRSLANSILSSNWRPEVIVAIARGGYVPAVLLCDYLAITDLVSIQLVHWPVTAEVLERAYVKYPLSTDLSGKKVLIVDDIVDTGETLELAKKHIMERCREVDVKTAALQWRSIVAKYKPDYWGIEVKHKAWFVYPWNFIEDTTNLILKVIKDMKEKGINEVTLNDLFKKLHEWYGDEFFRIESYYINIALKNLKEKRVLQAIRKNGYEVLRIE